MKHSQENNARWKRSYKGRNTQREYEKHLKHKAIEFYSGGRMCCGVCGFADIRALAIDHINDDGAIHRKMKRTSIGAWLRTNKYPPGFQVLCMNCNWIKETDRRQKVFDESQRKLLKKLNNGNNISNKRDQVQNYPDALLKNYELNQYA